MCAFAEGYLALTVIGIIALVVCVYLAPLVDDEDMDADFEAWRDKKGPSDGD